MCTHQGKENARQGKVGRNPSGEVGLGGSRNREEESEAEKVGDAVGGPMGLGKDLGLNSNSDGNSTLGFEQENNAASI